MAAGCADKNAASSGQNDNVSIPQTCTVHGHVTCSGKPVEGVTVSDGVEVTRTDADGYYELVSSSRYGYVFISVPGGYMCEENGALPLFWQTVKGKTGNEEHSFRLVSEPNDNHRLIVSADYHLGDIYDSQDIRCFEQFFLSDIGGYAAGQNSAKVYGIVLGDMTWDIFWEQYDMERYTAAAEDFPMTTFHVIGNHDYDMSRTDDFKAENVYRKYLGPTFYSFNLGKCHYVVLDNMVYTNTFSGGEYTRSHDTYVSQEQLEWLAKDLENVEKDTPLFICMHCPGFSVNGVSDTGGIMNVSLGFSDGGMEQQLADCLKGYTQMHLLTGDTHINRSIPQGSMPSGYGNLHEHNIAAVCASWWWTNYISGNSICKDGSEGGYMVFDNSGSDISWKYRSLKYGDEKQFRAYDMNTVLDFLATGTMVSKFYEKYPDRERYSEFGENTVLINVWNWDPSWEISVTENGKELALTQHYIEDPLHTISYDIPRTYTNGELTSSFRTIKTHHIFSAQAASATSALEITATDGFGDVYRETMSRPKPFNVDID